MIAPAGSRRRDDRGQASMVLVLAVPALLFVAILIIVVVGDATLKRSETRSAADAAALAAAEEWRSHVAQVISAADRGTPSEALDALRPLLSEEATSLDSGAVADRARQLAAANGARVTSLDVRRTARGIEFAVHTRNLDNVARTSTKAEADATAAVELTGGVCWNGSRLGLRYDGDCLSWTQLKQQWTPTPTPSPTPTASPTATPTPSPTPTPTPVSLLPFRAEVRLVA